MFKIGDLFCIGKENVALVINNNKWLGNNAVTLKFLTPKNVRGFLFISTSSMRQTKALNVRILVCELIRLLDERKLRYYSSKIGI